MIAEHKLPIPWQDGKSKVSVVAGAVKYYAQSPFVYSTGPIRDSITEAQEDADILQNLWDTSSPMRPLHYGDTCVGHIAQAAEAILRTKYNDS